jgi:hypothetical protein
MYKLHSLPIQELEVPLSTVVHDAAAAAAAAAAIPWIWIRF